MTKSSGWRWSTLHVLAIYAGLTLCIAGVYAWISLNSVPADGAEFWYWPVAAYNASAWSLMVACGLGALVVLMVWGLWLAGKAPNRVRMSVAAVLALGATGLMCWASLPVANTTYRHIGTASLADTTYHLGVRLSLDGNTAYVLSVCENTGLLCRARYLTEAGRPDFTVLPELLADPTTASLSIRVGDQVIYQFKP